LSVISLEEASFSSRYFYNRLLVEVEILTDNWQWSYQELIQLDLACGWSFGAHWSPSGNSLAYVGEQSPVFGLSHWNLQTRKATGHAISRI